MADNTTDRSEAEKTAAAAKLQAEAQKALAEARLAEAEAIKAEAEARRYAIDVQTLTYASEIAKRERDAQHRKYDAEDATDERNHLYRFVGAVTADSVKACVKKLTEWHRLDPGCDIEVVFSSPGGSITDGFILFDFMRDLSTAGHKVTTGSLGMAASMAGILLQAGDERWIGREAWLLIHRASFGAIGSTFEVEDTVEWIKKIEQRIIQIFVARSELTPQRIKKNWDRKDWWISSDECLRYGLVDEVRGTLPLVDA